MKVLDFFLTFSKFDYSKSQVAEETGVSRVTLEKVWNELTRGGIIVKTRSIGRAEMYKLNEKNPVTRTLDEFALQLAKARAATNDAGQKAVAKTRAKN